MTNTETDIKKKNLPEQVPMILAPVGGREQFFAALKAGADAVFLGLKNFNARARAENFDLDDMRELIPLANHYGMQVLITFNVLIKEAELKLIIRDIHELHDLGVHAIIIQDPAVIKLVRELAPHIRIHASTQMAVHNMAGVLQIAKLGAKRIVLARETTVQEMKKIYAGTRDYDLELEAFCHGSLCYSYSGLCFFSGAKDARSGNRGECSYTCRHPYKIVSEPGHGFLFSMKDLNTVENLEDLISAGIHTLKIEGRKKDAMYVTTAVRMYRQELDRIYGKSTLRDSAPDEAFRAFKEEEKELWPNLSYQRKPTKFFLSGRYRENAIDLENPTHVGMEAGEITEVKGLNISFVTKLRLEKYDGLRIDTSERLHHSEVKHGQELTGSRQGLKNRFDNKDTNFSLRKMRVNGTNQHVANIGDHVELVLSRDVILPTAGDKLFQVRSSELKAEIAKQITPPAGSRLRPLQPVDAQFEGTVANDVFTLRGSLITQGKTIISSSVELPAEAAKNPAGLQNGLAKQFKVLGQSGFMIKELHLSGTTDCFIPASLLKELKRKLEDNLEVNYEQTLSQLIDVSIQKYTRPKRFAVKRVTSSEAKYIIKFDKIENADAFLKFKRENPDFAVSEFIFEPKRAYLEHNDTMDILSKLDELVKATGAILRFSLPVVIRSWDEPFVNKWLKLLLSQGHTNFEVANPGAFPFLEKHVDINTLSLAADFTLYSLNSLAADVWNDQGISNISLSIEDDFTNISNQMKNRHNAAITYRSIVYKDTPLFIAEACSLTALHGGCPGSSICGYRTLEIENEEGERFNVAHENCKSIVYGDEAFSLSGSISKLRSIGINEFRVDFLTRPYKEDRIIEILTSVMNDTSIHGTHYANFYGQLK